MPVTAAISPTQDDATAAVGAFLLDVTGLTGADQIILGQPNRVAEPSDTTFVVMTPLRFERISTNLDTYADVVFTASSAGTVLTVTAVAHGALSPGALLFGVGVPAGVAIVSQTSGPTGGAGTYTLSQPITFSSMAFAGGGKLIQIDSQMTVQMDFHSADAGLATAASLADTVAATLRDLYGTDFFAALPAPQNAISPLYADNPVMRPFVNAEQNYEWRWVLEARFEINQVVRMPQQFAAQVKVTLIEVDSHYPP